MVLAGRVKRGECATDTVEWEVFFRRHVTVTVPADATEEMVREAALAEVRDLPAQDDDFRDSHITGMHRKGADVRARLSGNQGNPPRMASINETVQEFKVAVYHRDKEHPVTPEELRQVLWDYLYETGMIHCEGADVQVSAETHNKAKGSRH